MKKLFILLEIEPMTLLAFYAVGALVTLGIFYFIIKEAVKNGVIEAHTKMNISAISTSPIKDVEASEMNKKQLDLTKRYEKGEITLEDFKDKFNALK